MTEEFFEYDPAKVLDCAEAVEIFVADALETGDADYIVKAMRVVARARGMAQEADPEGGDSATSHADDVTLSKGNT